MRNLEMVRLRLPISFFLLICNILLIKSQEIKTFYLVQDKVKIDNAVVVAVKGSYELFLTSEKNISSNINIDKLILEGKMFLFNDNTLFQGVFPNEKKKLLGSCAELSRISTLKNKYTIFKLPKNITYFYFGFTTLKEYDNRTKNSEEKSYFKNNQNQFYPILFPICENLNLTE
ncbi:hypothetical protein MQX03_17025 [Chryseobacterium aahli]|uniref:hypothetical protein n=1 Tax=Chryseobacterium aahli TaxID=1278643 RepID=UPI001F601FC4|nr:hypothetical protein [Chryseobacterium aahli]MCI3938905.1 hypothetical protein [Chryseobacterium aahli]